MSKKEKIQEKIKDLLADNIITSIKDKEELNEALEDNLELLRECYGLINSPEVKNVKFMTKPTAFEPSKNFTAGSFVKITISEEELGENGKPATVKKSYNGVVIASAATYCTYLIDEEEITIEYAGHQDAVYVPETKTMYRSEDILFIEETPINYKKSKKNITNLSEFL